MPHSKEGVDAKVMFLSRVLALLFVGQHLQKVGTWAETQPNVDVLYVSYNDVLTKPLEHAERVNQFLGGSLDVEAMAAVVDPDLYRNRTR